MNEEAKRDPRNLKTDALDAWSWDANEPLGSLSSLRDASIDFATDTVNWYNRKKWTKQVLAKLLRGSAITVSGIAAVLLICSQQKGGLPVSWATGTLVVAGTLVALDRFFGFTNAWIRFIETANGIRVLLRSFRLDWEEQVSTWNDGKPSKEETAKVLELARIFVVSVDVLVTNEIAEWAQQFRSSVTRHNAKIENLLDQETESPPIRPIKAKELGAETLPESDSDKNARAG